jgi:hypothetical protein
VIDCPHHPSSPVRLDLIEAAGDNLLMLERGSPW